MKWVYALGGIAGLAVLAGGAWVYAASTVEQPAYERILKEDAYELRAYPSLVVARVRSSGGRDQSVREGFRALAGYIFAQGREGEKIAMTAPVLQARADNPADPWQVMFVMPSKFDLESLPAPARDEVTLGRLDAARVGAVRFSGGWTDARFERHEAALRSWLRARALPADAPAIYAYYNDPFTPAFLRRNEVLIPIGANLAP